MAPLVAGVGGVLRRSSSVCLSPSSFPSFLLLSLLLFSFRSALHLVTLSLTSSIHENPSLRSILTRVSDPLQSPAGSAPAAATHPPPFPRPVHHPHRHQLPQRYQDHPFIRSSRRLPTYEEEDDDEDGIFPITDLHPAYLRRLRPRSTRYHNSSYLFLRHYDFDADRGSDAPPLLNVHKFRVSDPSPSPVIFTSADHHLFEGENHREDDADRKVRLSSIVLDLDRRSASAVIYLACIFSAAHAYAMMGFLLCYSSAFGVVVVVTTASILGKTRPFRKTFYSGARLGFQCLPPLLFLRWAVRDSMAQFLSIFLLPDISDLISVLKLFVKVKLMPYSLTAPPPSLRFEPGFKWFIFAWTMLDCVVSTAFAVNCWVAIMGQDHRRNSREVVKEGFHLISNMTAQALLLRCLELAVCGNIGMRVIASYAGYLSAMLLQSIFEIYFMVAWLMFYFAARCKFGETDGSRFGWRELEDRFNAVM